MKSFAIVLGCILAIFLLFGGCVALTGVGVYNQFVQKNQEVKTAWGNVENVYQRRLDLLPNLVATVQGSANFEKSTLQAVIDARASVGRVNVNVNNTEAFINDSKQMQAFMQAQQGLSQALSRLMVVSEQYPDLKASANFRELQSQIEGTENRIAVERNKFNEKAGEFNTLINSFPNNVINNWFGHFKEFAQFKAEEGANKPPKVDFNFSGSNK